jgi:tetratricopeptide (TPR) repeat protein
LGTWRSARACFERAIKIGEATLGPNHPNVAPRRQQPRTCPARPWGPGGRAHIFERALQIDEATFGPHHPNVARDVNNLGLVLLALGDWNGARAALERAYAIYQSNLGDDHPTTMMLRINLQGVMLLQKLPRPIRFLLSRLERMITGQRRVNLERRMQEMIRKERERRGLRKNASE